jgi:hypothetical protein
MIATAVDLIRSGETVLAQIDPSAHGRDPEDFSRWLSARLTIAELPRLMLPGCDPRCDGVPHDTDAAVVLNDLALDPAEPRRPAWWSSWNETLERRYQSGRVWYAGAPAMPLTPRERRLTAGSRLRRISTTDAHWVAYEGAPLETLYAIADGPLEGDSLIVVSFGPAALLPALSGVLVAPDHPPVHDSQVAIRLLAAGWSAVERGLPFEE